MEGILKEGGNVLSKLDLSCISLNILFRRRGRGDTLTIYLSRPPHYFIHLHGRKGRKKNKAGKWCLKERGVQGGCFGY